MKSPTERFSDRVDYYVKYRPGYPEPLVGLLQEKVARLAVVADIGSGTGILTRQLLDAGYEVYGVEPNAPMRSAAEQSIGGNPLFHTVSGTAEITLLADLSVDLITAAQAFHWFKVDPTKVEFRRILKPGGTLAIIWNERNVSEVNRRWDHILQTLAPEYPRLWMKEHHRNIDVDAIRAFFAPGSMTLTKFDNKQVLDREALIGRFLSSSYVPNVGEPGFEEIISAVKDFFDDYQVDGHITIMYETHVYWGCLGG
jgi:SAM-dependent methyltransferase